MRVQARVHKAQTGQCRQGTGHGRRRVVATGEQRQLESSIEQDWGGADGATTPPTDGVQERVVRFGHQTYRGPTGFPNPMSKPRA
mmetsp:Transcript_39192/g.80274  ORF Transcript_39192/g.80274 Transcript_39192/m.80274 type:complete len:85 (+) Transcript_39192:531-785(+)